MMDLSGFDKGFILGILFQATCQKAFVMCVEYGLI